MITIKPPAQIPKDLHHKKSLFLAGSIEMGTAENWQHQFEQALSELDIVVLNPRRDDWDSSWVQRASNPQFRTQVGWELDALDAADVIAMYFHPATKAPVSLLELGLFASSGKLLVCCPDTFWRKGNVEIVCERYNVSMLDSLSDLIQKVVDLMR